MWVNKFNQFETGTCWAGHVRERWQTDSTNNWHTCKSNQIVLTNIAKSYLKLLINILILNLMTKVSNVKWDSEEFEQIYLSMNTIYDNNTSVE